VVGVKETMIHQEKHEPAFLLASMALPVGLSFSFSLQPLAFSLSPNV
jgi:hypothetical protein